MDLAHLAGTRRHRQTICMGEVRDLDVFGDASEPGHVGLGKGLGASSQKCLEGVQLVELLAERDWDRG